MKFQNYISAIFYLQESLRYITTPTLNNEIKASIQRLIEQGGEDAECNHKGFTVWSELSKQIPDLLDLTLSRSSPKELFKKSETRLNFYAYSEYTNHPYQNDLEEMDFCGGKLTIERTIEESRLRIYVTIIRPKLIIDTDISNLAQRISKIHEEVQSFNQAA